MNQLQHFGKHKTTLVVKTHFLVSKYHIK